MNATDMRSKSAVELRQELTSLLREEFNLRMQKVTGQLARPHQFKRIRRDIARIKTVMNEQSKAGNAA
jgi:large subunit ribosomal protein L29